VNITFSHKVKTINRSAHPLAKHLTSTSRYIFESARYFQTTNRAIFVRMAPPPPPPSAFAHTVVNYYSSHPSSNPPKPSPPHSSLWVSNALPNLGMSSGNKTPAQVAAELLSLNPALTEVMEKKYPGFKKKKEKFEKGLMGTEETGDLLSWLNWIANGSGVLSGIAAASAAYSGSGGAGYGAASPPSVGGALFPTDPLVMQQAAYQAYLVAKKAGKSGLNHGGVFDKKKNKLIKQKDVEEDEDEDLFFFSTFNQLTSSSKTL
jgi:hypothetical protein